MKQRRNEKRAEADCECSEGFILVPTLKPRELIRRRVSGRHDCDYIRARDALIPEAEFHALGQLGSTRSPAWTAAFMVKMDQLALERIYGKKQ